MSASITTRAATPADATAIARINVETWHTAYRGIIPDAHLDALTVVPRAERWEKGLRENTTRVLVAESDGALAGYVAFGPCRDEGESHETELYAIYIDTARQRSGLGRLLMGEAERRLIALLPAATRISLWVLARNTDARHFYEQCGYLPGSKEKQVEIGGRMLDELRYEKAIHRVTP